jgi:hypothetical protein
MKWASRVYIFYLLSVGFFTDFENNPSYLGFFYFLSLLNLAFLKKFYFIFELN